MKSPRFLFLTLINVVFAGSLLSQTTISLTFSANMDGAHQPLDSIFIMNQTRGWATVLEYPDTVLALEHVTSISEICLERPDHFVFSPLFPNPSTEHTTARIFLPHKEEVRLHVSDLSGRTLATWQRILPAGQHTFSLYPGNADTYLVVVETNRQRQVQKLIGLGGGNNGFAVKYLGSHTATPVSQTQKTGLPWEPGDQLRFTGYVTLTGNVLQSDTMSDSPLISSSYTFQFTDPSSASYRPGTVHCNPSNPTVVVDVVNAVTGKVWMDRNLGASRVANSATDSDAYGDLYQWGRFADGHQCRTSPIGSTISPTDQPGHGDFIAGAWDWRSPPNDTLWYGESGVNNPCPIGYRLPTEAELNAERLSWQTNNTAGAFASPLKFTNGGWRGTGGLGSDWGTSGRYWSMTTDGANNSMVLHFHSMDASTMIDARAIGGSVRCIKN